MDTNKRDRADIERAAKSPKNEGEGSQSGARDYDDRTRHFVASGQVEQKAKEAEKAIEGKEGAALRKAEAEGKKHAKGEDPALRKH
jgi:hypothetical protein